VLEQKSGNIANISETRWPKDRGKVTIQMAYRNAPTLFRTVLYPQPLRPEFFWLPPIISGTGYGPHNYGLQFWPVYIHLVPSEQKSIKIMGKVAVGVARDSRKFSGHP